MDPKIPESSLNDAERKVLDAFREHEPTVALAGAEIHGDFLRDLFLGKYEDADYRGTCIVGANINDEFNMEFCETKFPVRFHDCTFAQKIKLQQLTCPELDFSGCTLKEGVDARYAKVVSSVFLSADDSDGKHAKEFKAEGGVDLSGTEIGGQLVCAGGSFQNDGKIALNARGIKAAGGVFLRGRFNAMGEVNLSGADIEGQLVCEGGSFQNENGEGCALNAQGIKVSTGVFLSGEFNAVGEVSLSGADIGGQLACAGGSFRNEKGRALNAQGIKVAETMFLSGGFNAVGEVSLAGAKVEGQLNCAGGSLRNEEGNALNAQNITVAEDVSMSGEFKGAVYLSGADIRGQLDCTDGNFQTLNARSIKVANEALIRNLSANGLVYFADATIGATLELNNCKLTQLSLAGANVLGEFRDDADVYKDRDGNDIALNIDGFRYHRLHVAKERVEDRIAWAGSMSKGDEFRPQPYEQLMKVYREMGHMNWARKAGFALENMRQEKMKPGWWKKWYWLLRHTIGYGYEPFRSITHWFAPLIIAGLVLFSGILPCPDSQRAGSWLCHCMAPSDAGVLLSDDWKTHEKLPKDYPDFNPVYYAVEAALPVLPLGQTQNWHPKTWWAKWLQGAITIIGALVLTILASYGVGVLGPRWKDG